MEIIVSKHAIDQYRVKMFSTLSLKEIEKILVAIVRKGKDTGARPGGARGMQYNGIAIVVKKQEDKTVIITCLGNGAYRGWCRRNEILPRYVARVS